MKVVIRRSVFETNSSSNHCLILTKKEDMEEKLNKVRKEYEWFMSVGTEENPIVSKEDKCYLLQGIFEEQLSSDFCSETVYDIFKQVLKDNNETEILEKIEKHMVDFNENNYCMLCEEYFCHGTLCDCDCDFLYLLEKFFDVKINYVLDENAQYVVAEESKKDIYDMFYKYIYQDVIVIPYEYI
jgi:hypothetical protein